LSGGKFQIEIELPGEYPLVAPHAFFKTRTFHPNVDSRTGEICLDVLKSDWSPAWGIGTICRAIIALLAAPNAESPLNCDAGNLIRSGDMVAFKSLARMYTVEYAVYMYLTGFACPMHLDYTDNVNKPGEIR
jgi:peroxin-4